MDEVGVAPSNAVANDPISLQVEQLLYVFFKLFEKIKFVIKQVLFCN